MNKNLNISREYKSEYKQKFRPFSQYEYIGDGNMSPNHHHHHHYTL